MPLKPIYEKSPLVALKEIPLRPGQVRVNHAKAEQLYAMASACLEQTSLWEGVFRLACILKAKPMEEPVAKKILLAMEGQPDGVAETVAIMRAALAVYEYDAKRSLLEKLAAWCGWLAENWEQVMVCADVRVHAADLMELLQVLYRVTGKKAILSLCDKLRQQAMDWSGILHTFAVQRPMNRVTFWKDMEAGLEAENGSEAGFYTRQYLTCHGESLADGVRSARQNGLFSGNGQELSAAKAGWEKVSRYHGAVCGGITADETIGGRSPSCAVDAASLGAWAEALSACDTEETWACEAVEALLENGLPATLNGEKLIPFQRVNSLAENCGTKDCYHVHEGDEQVFRALNRLCRGYARAISSAVTVGPEGFSVNQYIDGRYAVPMADGPWVITVNGGKVSISAKAPGKAAVRLRIPSWTKDACVTVNDEGGYEGKPGTWLTLERTWQDGDRVTLDFPKEITVADGYHQSLCVRYGAKVLAYAPAMDAWNVALCAEPVLENGRVTAMVKRVPDWRKNGSVPGDLPVLPATEGEAFPVELIPYAEAPCRIALFPKGEGA